MSLSQEQYDTTVEPNENKIVVALPGSGKTHTSVSFTQSVLEKVPGSSVLLVTFTNASAEEMGNRLETRLGALVKRTRSLTFASVMLKQFAPLKGVRQLLLGGEQLSYIRRCLTKLKVNTDNLMMFAERIDAFGRLYDFKNDGSLSSSVYVEYLNMLARFNRVDLNTVAREVVEALIAGKIKPVNETHIVVDEYQDTDALQYMWISVHANYGKYIFAVGDDDQSIYSWRGAEGYENIVRLQEDHGAVGYVLSKCFRCAPKILAAAKRLVENNVERIPKDMSSGRDIEGSVQIIEIPEDFQSNFSQERSQRDTIEITNMKTNSKVKVSDPEKADKELEAYRYVVEKIQHDPFGWAILSRTNVHLDLMEQALAERQINVVRLGGKSIFDNEHASGIVKLLAAISQPKMADHLSDGLGWLGEDDGTVHAIYLAASNIGFAACSSMNSREWLPATAALQQLASDWRDDTQLQGEIESRMEKFNRLIIKHLEGAGDDKSYGMQRAILKLCTDIVVGSKGSFESRVQSLLEKATRGKKKKVDHKVNDAVILCTMNSSKGLEFPKVWIINVEEGRVPLIKDDEVDIDSKIEEERRLMYVAMTRAEDELKISYRVKKESMFIQEIRGYSD
ncbi:ATP-dependent helicase [Rheinheimera hassiensis]|uniref:ATP-dependent helicase n=1 Tax=Rheinheimera hassiensis TaxID=1193627 RepID=UPI001F05F124|nr:ATP-dependent helicase [Rheinheimera hassiensis]